MDCARDVHVSRNTLRRRGDERRGEQVVADQPLYRGSERSMPPIVQRGSFAIDIRAARIPPQPSFSSQQLKSCVPRILSGHSQRGDRDVIICRVGWREFGSIEA